MSLLAPLLDRSVVLSFDRTGFQRHARDFDPADLQVDLSGRHVAVTGANSGLGAETARALAGLGATVWMLCRTAETAASVADDIRTAHPGADLRTLPLDLSDPASIDACAAALDAPLDVLVHNAGMLPLERARVPWGLERCLAVNLVGPHRLTLRLLDRLRAAPAPRLIHVSSGGMYGVKLDTDALEGAHGAFDGVQQYARTKRAQVVLTEALAARWPDVAVHALHPGWADTPGVASSLPRFHALTARILRTPAQGADTTVWLAAVEAIPGPSGTFWFDRRPAPTHLSRVTRASAAERARAVAQIEDWALQEPAPRDH